jgi:hypothetical protein
MDLEKLTHHKNYGQTVVIALLLSATMVVAAAVIGRGTLNLKSALVAERVTVPVVMQLFSEDHPVEIIGDVEELPARQEIVGSAFVVTTDAHSYYMRVSPTKPWETLELKIMHGDTL